MPYFTPKTTAFLRDLRAHNDKAWFEAHKADYEAHVREPALRFIEDVGNWFEAAGLPYVAVAKKAGGSLGRIHRDVRFSKNKTPYQDHVILHFRHRDTTDEQPLPGLGIRFDADGAGLGGGVWTAPTVVLNRIRDAIVDDPEGWRANSEGVTLGGDRLKTAPRGYPRDHPLVDDLRLTNFLGHVDLAPSDLTGDLLRAFQVKGRPVLEYNQWLERALR